jgi:hypothetical protein
MSYPSHSFVSTKNYSFNVLLQSNLLDLVLEIPEKVCDKKLDPNHNQITLFRSQKFNQLINFICIEIK